MPSALTAELENALLRELLEAWTEINRRDFTSRLRAPVLELHDRAALGGFTPDRRSLSLRRDFVVQAPWGQVIEVLRHEVAHQFVHEALGVTDEPPHGPTFRRVCRERGIDARAAGLPDASPDAREARLVRRVRALLRLAESPEPHEAAAAATAARRLLARHDLDLGAPSERYTFKQVGPTKARFDPWEKRLAGVLSAHFGVQVIYALAYRPRRGTWGRVLELLGPAHHVEVAAYVHDVLRDSGEAAWRAHKRRQGIRKDAERRRFLYGVMDGFQSALDVEVPATETALVPVEEVAMERYVRGRYPRLRSGRRMRVKVTGATAAGREAGRKLQIRPGMTRAGRDPRALPDRGSGDS